jgi:O-succinylbenzoic acid--CoA ligase
MHFSSGMDVITAGKWYHGEDSTIFAREIQQTRDSLRTLLKGNPKTNTALILSSDTRSYMLGAAAAILESCNLILGSAHWGEDILNRLHMLLPDQTLVWNQQWELLRTPQQPSIHSAYEHASPWIAIATGGTSGTLKLAVHTPDTLTAAALGLQRFLGDSLPLNSIINLPLHHVSGWMPLWRAWSSNGRVTTLDKLQQHPLVCPEEWLLSWVPTQLYRALRHEKPSLPCSRLRGIFIGGAGLDDHLAAQARQLGWRLIPSYGMTETAALVAALKPELFLSGVAGYGSALPHARLHISAEQILTIESDSLFLGYLGDLPHQQRIFSPHDLAQWSVEGSLHILGRTDHLINSGGEKVSPEQVEQVIMKSGLVEDTAVTGLPDLEWGERVVALIQWRVTQDSNSHSLLQYLRQHLSRWQIPQQLISVPQIPRNSTGKLLRTQLKELANISNQANIP